MYIERMRAKEVMLGDLPLPYIFACCLYVDISGDRRFVFALSFELENHICHVEALFGLNVDELVGIVGVFEHVKESFVSPCFNEGACNLVHILHRDAITEIGINDDSVVTTCDGALDDALNRVDDESQHSGSFVRFLGYFERQATVARINHQARSSSV